MKPSRTLEVVDSLWSGCRENNTPVEGRLVRSCDVFEREDLFCRGRIDGE